MLFKAWHYGVPDKQSCVHYYLHKLWHVRRTTTLFSSAPRVHLETLLSQCFVLFRSYIALYCCTAVCCTSTVACVTWTGDCGVLYTHNVTHCGVRETRYDTHCGVRDPVAPRTRLEHSFHLFRWNLGQPRFFSSSSSSSSSPSTSSCSSLKKNQIEDKKMLITIKSEGNNRPMNNGQWYICFNHLHSMKEK